MKRRHSAADGNFMEIAFREDPALCVCVCVSSSSFFFCFNFDFYTRDDALFAPFMTEKRAREQLVEYFSERNMCEGERQSGGTEKLWAI